MTTTTTTYRETLRGKCEHIRKSQTYAESIAAEFARDRETDTRLQILKGMYRANIADHMAHCVRGSK